MIIFVNENPFENVICKLAVILLQLEYVRVA